MLWREAPKTYYLYPIIDELCSGLFYNITYVYSSVDSECPGKPLPKESTKIRLKIKRDNVLELPLLKKEAAEKDKTSKCDE